MTPSSSTKAENEIETTREQQSRKRTHSVMSKESKMSESDPEKEDRKAKKKKRH